MCMLQLFHKPSKHSKGPIFVASVFIASFLINYVLVKGVVQEL
jgi:hypothetical protein